MKITPAMVEACRRSMGKGWGFDFLGCESALRAIGWLNEKSYFGENGRRHLELALAWIVTIGPCDLGEK